MSLLLFLFFLFFILPLFYVIVVFICSFFSSIGSFNIPDCFASGSGGSSGPGLPSNLPGGGLPGPNDFKLKLSYILSKDTDNLADYMETGLRGWYYHNGLRAQHFNHVPLSLKELGMPAADISPVTWRDIAHESEVFRFITNNGYIQLNINSPINASMIDSVRALKLNLPRA